jgi:hypothetical protein
MDTDKLRVLVFEKTGIKIDKTDPIFALVALNDAVITASVEKHAASMLMLSDELDRKVSVLSEISDKVGAQLVQLAQVASDNATRATELAIEAGQTNVRRITADAASDAMRTVSAAPVEAAVADIGKAGKRFSDLTEESITQLRRAARQVTWKWWQRAGVAFVMMVLAAFVALASHQWVNNRFLAAPSTDQLSAKDQFDLGNGRMLSRIWPQLDTKTQQHIKELAGKADK